ncbi:hypothetical protein NMY22_g955 [Coprinellus aureogranulatus]|nr:hypothetical protein NMY22_g955 [Coprinellus aureogranulatus]
MSAVTPKKSHTGWHRRILRALGRTSIFSDLGTACSPDDRKNPPGESKRSGDIATQASKITQVSLQNQDLGEEASFPENSTSGSEESSYTGGETSSPRVPWRPDHSGPSICLRPSDTLPKHPDVSGIRSEYLPGSRTADVTAIRDWIERPSSELVMWVYAPAGLGKSTLAHHLKQELRSIDRLGAALFISALPNADSLGPETIIQTIAGEIGRTHLRAVPAIVEAMHECNAATLRTQLRRYILNPLLSLRLDHPLVIILDAVDEWKFHPVFVKELAALNTHTHAIKFILLGRLHPKSSPRASDFLCVSTFIYPLCPASTTVIRTFFQRHLTNLHWDFGRQPTSHELHCLAEKAQGVFAWAATVCSMVADPFSPVSPREFLDAALQSRGIVGNKQLLAELYHSVIKRLFPRPRDMEQLREYLEAVTALQEALPIDDFSGLVGMPKRLIQHIQLALTALQIRYPGTTDATVYPALRLFHLSFIEYLQSPATPPEHSFPVPARQSHACLGEACLKAVSSLARAPTGTAYMSPRNLYAITHWALHTAVGTCISTELDWTGESHYFLLAQMLSLLFTNGQMYSWDVADRLRAGDSPTAMFRISLLEIASRLQERNSSNWRELGWAHSIYAKDTFSEDHIDRAVNAHRRAVKVAAEDDDDDEQSSRLYSLATALETRFRLQGCVQDLEESIPLHRSAVSLRPPGHPERILSQNNLANALRARFDQVGAVESGSESVQILRDYLRFSRKSTRFQRILAGGLFLMVEEAIFMLREICRGPNNNPSRFLTNLACCLCARSTELAGWARPRGDDLFIPLAMFLDTRSVCVDSAADLEESISLKRESLTLRPEGHPDRWHGIVEDLEESVKVVRGALSLQPTGHPRRFCTLDTAALCLRFRRDNVEESLSTSRQAVELLPASGVHQRSALATYTLWPLYILFAHHHQHLASEKTRTIEEAVAVCTERLRFYERKNNLKVLPERVSVYRDRVFEVCFLHPHACTAGDWDTLFKSSTSTLVACPYLPIYLPWGQLRYIALYDTNAEGALEVLPFCKNATEIKVTVLWGSYHRLKGTPTLLRPVQSDLPLLEHLMLYAEDPGFTVTVLSGLFAPKVRTVYLDVYVL